MTCNHNGSNGQPADPGDLLSAYFEGRSCGSGPKAAAFADCPLAGKYGKYFKACLEGDKTAEERAEIWDRVNVVCGVCGHNEICNSACATRFSAMDGDIDGEIRSVERAERAKRNAARSGDIMLPDYFGELYYMVRKRGDEDSVSCTGLFVKNLTGSVTLVPGILPLFDPHTCILTCVEVCGLSEEAFDSLYRIIENGVCPAVYVSIPKDTYSISFKSRPNFIELCVKSKDGPPLKPACLVICGASDGYPPKIAESVAQERQADIGGQERG